MNLAGARLKKVRLEKGISLEDAHKATKIHLDILKSIEENSFINLSPVYIKGFLKIYCKYLGVDPREYIPDYKGPQSTVRIEEGQKDAQALILQTPTSSLNKFFSKVFNAKTMGIIFRTALVVILIFGLFKIGSAVKHALLSKKAKSSATSLAKAKKEVAPKSKQTKPQATVVKPESPKTATKPEANFKIRLAIRAKEDCWAQLKADGRVIFQNILKKGRSESWEAKDKIELSLGNAGGVDLEINGRLIPSLGRRGQALKNILITKEGLSVGR